MPRPMRSLPLAAASMPVASSPEPASSCVQAVVERGRAEAELTCRAGELSGAGGGLRDALVELPASRRDAPEPDDEPVRGRA